MCLQDEPEHFFWNEITGEVQWEGMLPTTAQQMAQRVSQPASTSQPATPTIDQSASQPASQHHFATTQLSESSGPCNTHRTGHNMPLLFPLNMWTTVKQLCLQH